MKKSKLEKSERESAQAATVLLGAFAGQLDAKVGNPLRLDAAALRSALSHASAVSESEVDITVEAVHDGTTWKTRVIARFDV